MNSYMDLSFQWYNNGIKTIKPSGFITLRQLINAIISPKPEMVENFKLIKEAGARGDKATKDKLKEEKLFFTTPSAIFDPIRNYESIKEFRPFGVYEYDNIDYCEELRDYIFERRQDCIFAFCSPSFTGTKFIFLFGETPTSIEHYKALWFGIAHDLDKFINLDLSNERCTQPLYNSYDPNSKFREDAVGKTVWGYKTTAMQYTEVNLEILEEASYEVKQQCFKRVAYLIDRICDSAHNQVISTAFLSGGLCPYYGIPTEDMWQLLEDRIRDNEYMQKGTNNYLKTAKTMFNKGLSFPKTLNKDE